MQDNFLVAALMFSSLCIVVLNFAKFKLKHPVAYISAFYFFFGFGPVLNYLFEFPIYFGIVKENIPLACFIMFLGILSFSVPHLIMKKISIEENIESPEKHEWDGLKVAYLFSILYSVIKIALMVPLKLGGATKIDMINSALPQIHYIFLLVQLYLCAFYFSAQKNGLLRKLYWANILSYVLYCVVIGERDFIFVLFSLGVMKVMTQKKKISFIKLGLGLFALISFATALFYLRDETQDSENILSAILGQGSILFINTYVIKIMSSGHQLFYGETFYNSLINLLPSFIYTSDYNNLAWFKNIYAPKSDSGYGFALDAEGYINFGLVGVIFVYSSIAIYWRLLMNRINTTEFYRYLTFFSIGFTMYSIRNDSLAFLKGILYSIIIYFAIQLVSYFLFIWRKQ